jgi:hypothetical protein
MLLAGILVLPRRKEGQEIRTPFLFELRKNGMRRERAQRL